MENRVCPWWMAYTFDNPLRRLVHPPEKILGPYLSSGMTVLDVGCGMGGFSIAMARMVGETGCVVSVDLQQKMLDILNKRAKKAGLDTRIRTHLCPQDSLGLSDPLDFALAFFMVHETPDQSAFFTEIRNNLKTNGKLFMAEPPRHVPHENFQKSLATAENAGLKLLDQPRMRLAQTAVFTPE